MTRSKGVAEEDWECRKSLIRRRVLTDNVPSQQLLGELADSGLHATKKQLEYRLKKWGFMRNIPRRGWIYIDHKIAKRRRAGKPSAVFYCSAEVKAPKIEKETYRNRDTSVLARFQNAPSPKTPPDLDIIVCTPPSQGTVIGRFPPNLPWLKFQRNWSDAFSKLEFYSSPIVGVRHDSIELTSLFADLNLEFGDILQFENRGTAAIRGLPSALQDIAMRLVFVSSNNGDGFEFQNRHGFVLRKRVWRALSTCLQQSGLLDTAPNFASLGDLTMSAFIEKLFRLSMYRVIEADEHKRRHDYNSKSEDDNSETKGILRWMLSCGYPLNRPTITLLNDRPMTPLQIACSYGVADLANMFVDAGADPNSTVGFCWQIEPPLCLLLSYMEQENVQSSPQILLVKRLLEIGAEVNPTPKGRFFGKEWFPLVLATNMGNIPLMELLICNGANLRDPVKQTGFSISPANGISALGAAAEYQGSGKFDANAATLVSYLLRKWNQLFPDLPAQDFIIAEHIMRAARSGNVDVLQLSYNVLGRLDLTDENGISALHHAASYGRLEACDFLLHHGVSVDTDDTDVPSPLHVACMSGRVDVAKFLYQHGAQLERIWEASPYPGRSLPPSWGCRESGLGPKRKLSPFGATITATSIKISPEEERCALFLLEQGVAFTPGDLYQAVDCYKFDLALALLKAGDNPNQGMNEKPILELAIERFHEIRESGIGGNLERLVNALLQRGVQPGKREIFLAIKIRSWYLVTRLIESGASWDTLSATGESALEAVILTGQSDMITKAFDIDQSFYEAGALCAAVAFAVEYDDYTWAARLLKNRPVERAANKLEGTALAMAISSQNLLLVDLLLEHLAIPEAAIFPNDIWKLARYGNFDINPLFRNISRPFWRDNGTWVEGSPMVAAAARGNAQLLQDLLTRGLQPDYLTLTTAALRNSQAIVDIVTRYLARSSRSNAALLVRIPLYWAIHHKNLALFRALVDFGERVDNICPCYFDDGHDYVHDMYNIVAPRSCLQTAVEYNFSEVIDTLLELGAEVNEPPAPLGGATSLQLAAITGNLATAKKLIDLGADINAPGARYAGRTALEGAAEHGRIDMVQLLLSEGADTVGPGRAQYVRAVARAISEGHATVARILREHGGWGEEDQELMEVEDLLDPGSISGSDDGEDRCSLSEEERREERGTVQMEPGIVEAPPMRSRDLEMTKVSSIDDIEDWEDLVNWDWVGDISIS